MKRKLYGISTGFYLAIIILTAFGSSMQVALAACSSNGDLNSAWSSNYHGYYYWDGSVPSSLNSTIEAGTTTWNGAPYKSPTFYVTSNASIANGVVKFQAGIRCGLSFEVAACTNNTTQSSPRKWETVFNSNTCYISSSEGSIAGCYNVGHVMGHEFGHVMALADNYSRDSGSDDSIIGNIYYSNEAGGSINSRRCGDDNGLNRRYGVL